MVRQASLTSFFGGSSTDSDNKKKSNQKRLDSFFGGASSSKNNSKNNKENEKSDDVKKCDNKKKNKNDIKVAEEKENSSPKKLSSSKTSSSSSSSKSNDKKKSPGKRQLAEDDNKEEEGSTTVATNKEKKKTENLNKRRRRVIDDDDDDSDYDEDVTMEEMKNEEQEEKHKSSSSKGESADGKDKINRNKSNTEDNDITMSEADDDDDSEKSCGKDSVKNKIKPMSLASKTSCKPEKKKNNTVEKKKLINKSEKEEHDNDDDYKDDDNDDDGTSSSKSKLPPKSQLLKSLKGQVKSDQVLYDQLITDLDGNTGSLPYSVLCEAFEQIEAITGRLHIQEIFTNLVRKVILRSNMQGDGEKENDDKGKKASAKGEKNSNNNNNSKQQKDLYAVMYLASNTVAPAYKCIELGIGDAILIKAISEAYGTNSKVVKQKYDEDGDLGIAAQTFKSKQRTLGGFFGASKKQSNNATKKKNVLTCQEVLTTFREIANMKGNQSQKWKTDKIKKLLVKATITSETKYIIRGLQGKLRIGLAQSTVLISLAHAVALTQPKLQQTIEKETKDNDDGTRTKDDYDNNCGNVADENENEDNDPEEVVQYCNRKLPPEKRLEGAANIVKKAYSEVPSYDSLLDALVINAVPLEQLYKSCTLQPGIPIVPMLAKPTKSIQEVLKRLNGLNFTCEYKYDGERAQVHMLTNGTTKVFSRNLLDTSEKFPEVPLFVKEAIKNKINDDDKDNNADDEKEEEAAAAAKEIKDEQDDDVVDGFGEEVTSFVLDTEVVAWNNKTKQFVPFQVLSTRKRSEESAESAKVQVIVQAFDLMYLNGKSLLNSTLAQRRRLMSKYFQEVPNKFQFATWMDTTEDGDTTMIEEFLDKAVKSQCEGLMVKTLDTSASIYEPSRRSLNWLKLKKDYLDGAIGDSIDLVPIGAFYGRGKRTGVYGAYLLACYDVDTEEYQSVCKIGTGFSDENLVKLANGLNEHQIPNKSSQYNVSDQLCCDVWFDAVQVWEIKAADLSKSSLHKGAEGKTGEAGRGIGLRFPRFERERKDKKPEEATTSDQILEMYYVQDSVIDSNDGGMRDGGDAITNDDDGI